MHCLVKQYVLQLIKIMNKSRMVDIVDIERVQRELSILNVRHPNIIMFYEVFETNKYIFIVMEYCQKELLVALLKRTFSCIVKKENIIIQQKIIIIQILIQTIPEINACALFQQLLSGIEYLHKLNIVHQIKSRIKIVDFGLSNTCGSPYYAAPEMISGKLYRGLKADI